jgi:hypothetical protein
MEINFNYSDRELILVYNKHGILDYVTDSNTGDKMMLELNQVGSGYEMEKNNGYIPMDICKATYIRIMDLDIFIPKFIFIPQKNLKS